MGGLDADALSWAALLAQCTDYARATASLRADGDDGRWRESTVPVVALHAVSFALRQIGRVDEDERALSRDRASVLIREHVSALDGIWRGIPMPESLLQLQDDARTALDRAAYVGAVELVWTGPSSFVVPTSIAGIATAIEDGSEPAVGTLLVMQPGTIVMPGEPVAWWVDRPWPDGGDAFDALEPADTDAPRQVYRVLDEQGRIERDLLSPIWCEPQAGMPLLVPLLAAGVPVGRFTVEAAVWEARQRAAMPGDPDEAPLPVESLSCEGPGEEEDCTDAAARPSEPAIIDAASRSRDAHDSAARWRHESAAPETASRSGEGGGP